MKSVLTIAALLFVVPADAAPPRRGKATQRKSTAGKKAAAAAAKAMAGLCRPTITCKVGKKTGFVLPRKSGPSTGSDGKIWCSYAVERSGKQWVETRKSKCQDVPVTQCTNLHPVMRVRRASVSFMTSTPRDGKCLVMPRVSLRQK
jgi:hypothetical protein